MPRYSTLIRNTRLKKMLPPENRSSAEYGVSVATIYGWKARMNNGTLQVDDGAQSNRRLQLTEKLSLLLESKTVSEQEFGSWLRDNELHSEHLTGWEQEVHKSVAKGEKELRDELREVKKKHKELDRKEKALAEMAAIITLPKKRNCCFRTERTTNIEG